MNMNDDLSKYFKKDDVNHSFDESSDVIHSNEDDKNITPEERMNSIFDLDKKIKNNKDSTILTEKTVSMSVEEFNAFISALRGIRYSCSDVIIKNGVISQSNEKRTFFINIDLRSVLGDTSLIINNLPIKHELFVNIFQRQNVDVRLKILKEKYVMMDSSCKLEFIHPNSDLVGAEFKGLDNLEKVLKKDTSRPIFNYTFKKMLMNRIISTAKLLESNSLFIIFDDNSAKLNIQPYGNNIHTIATLGTITPPDLATDVNLENLMVLTKVQMFMNFLNSGCEEIHTKMFHRTTTEPSCCFELSSNIVIAGTDDVIPFTIYAMLNFLNPATFQE
jgi:hypothetical protein